MKKLVILMFALLFLLNVISADYSYCKNLVPSSSELRENEVVNVNITDGNDFAFVSFLYTGNFQNYSVFYNNITDIQIFNTSCDGNGTQVSFEVIDASQTVSADSSIYEWYDLGYGKSDGSSLEDDGFWIYSQGNQSDIYYDSSYLLKPYGKTISMYYGGIPVSQALISNVSSVSEKVYSFYFYDTGENTSTSSFAFMLNPGASGNYLGAYMSTSVVNYTRRLSGSYAPTDISRTIGWHTGKAIVNSSGLFFYIDGRYVGTNGAVTTESVMYFTSYLRDSFWSSYVQTTGQDVNQYVNYTDFSQILASDLVNPVISYSEGTEADSTTFYSRDYIFVNVSVTEKNEDTIVFYLLDNGNNVILENSFTDGTRDIVWSSLTDGTYKYYVYVNDSLGNSAQTTQRTITIYNNAEENYPLFNGEIVYTGENRNLYDNFRTVGAGLGKFLEYMTVAFPFFILGFFLVGFVMVFAFAIYSLFKKWGLFEKEK